MRVVLIALIAVVLSGPAMAQMREVLAVNIGWHVGLAFSAGDLDTAVFPEVADFPDARWIEIGWGDAAFYQDPDPDLNTILEAALVPTPAVLHLVAMPAHPARYLPGAEVLAIPLGAEPFTRLVTRISSSMRREERTRAEAIAPGLYPDSRFYPATGRFHLGRTCNTWVAETLAEAGVPIDPDGVVTADTLMKRLRAGLAGGMVTPPAGSDLR
ncbi:DUF2459 domain-containing protein [Thalassobaculum sp.]|uniref:DUF2459 domain-containing protein n=1 Tax=Thalassobaculum sp. TaxID=2022740 RepID=UPI0032ECA526